MRQGGASTRASRSAFPRRPGAFHWSSAEIKIPGSFFGVPIPGFAVEVLLNYDLWRESTEVAGEKDQWGGRSGGNLDHEPYGMGGGGCGGPKEKRGLDAACEDHREARWTAQWLTTAALFFAALACFPILGFACCQSTQVVRFCLFLGLQELVVVCVGVGLIQIPGVGGLLEITCTICSLAFLLVLALNLKYKYALFVSKDDDKEKSKVSAGLSAALALGGVLAIAGAANYGSAMASAFDNYEDLGWEVVDSDTCKWGCSLSIGGGAIAVIVGAVGVGLHVKSPPAGDGTKVADSEADKAVPVADP